MMLLKEDFVAELAKKGYTKKSARYIIDDVFDTMTECLARGDDVTVRGFGKFEIRRRAARTARNPITNEVIHVDEHNGVQFTSSASLRQAVNQGIEL